MTTGLPSRNVDVRPSERRTQMNTPLASVKDRAPANQALPELPPVLGVCDRHPSAAALVRVVIGEQDMDYCGHCYYVNEVALRLAGWNVLADNR